MAKLYLGTREVTPSIYKLSNEIPSYAITNGSINKNSAVLDGTEFSNVTAIMSWDYGFYKCYLSGILNLPGVFTIAENSMAHCFDGNRISSFDLSNLFMVEQKGLSYAFANGSNLTNVTFPLLSNILEYGLEHIFDGCSNLTTVTCEDLFGIVDEGALEGAFRRCTSLANIYFYNLANDISLDAFVNMMTSTGYNITHTLHFPSNMESTIQGLTGYPNFGGTSGYVVLAYDLPATS